LKGFYGYFETNYDPAPAYYHIGKEGKLRILYQPGDDAALDNIIKANDDPGKAIVDVVKYFSNKNNN